MRKRIVIIIIILLLTLIPSCVPNRSDFSKKKYIRGNHHKRIPIFFQDRYKDPWIKPERKKELVKPNIINLDKW